MSEAGRALGSQDSMSGRIDVSFGDLSSTTPDGE